MLIDADTLILWGYGESLLTNKVEINLMEGGEVKAINLVMAFIFNV